MAQKLHQYIVISTVIIINLPSPISIYSLTVINQAGDYLIIGFQILLLVYYTLKKLHRAETKSVYKYINAVVIFIVSLTSIPQDEQ